MAVIRRPPNFRASERAKLRSPSPTRRMFWSLLNSPHRRGAIAAVVVRAVVVRVVSHDVAAARTTERRERDTVSEKK